jgi:hypothetical protein
LVWIVGVLRGDGDAFRLFRQRADGVQPVLRRVNGAQGLIDAVLRRVQSRGPVRQGARGEKLCSAVNRGINGLAGGEPLVGARAKLRCLVLTEEG